MKPLPVFNRIRIGVPEAELHPFTRPPAYNESNRCLPGQQEKQPTGMFSLSVLSAWFHMPVPFSFFEEACIPYFIIWLKTSARSCSGGLRAREIALDFGRSPEPGERRER